MLPLLNPSALRLLLSPLASTVFLAPPHSASRSHSASYPVAVTLARPAVVTHCAQRPLCRKGLARPIQCKSLPPYLANPPKLLLRSLITTPNWSPNPKLDLTGLDRELPETDSGYLGATWERNLTLVRERERANNHDDDVAVEKPWNLRPMKPMSSKITVEMGEGASRNGELQETYHLRGFSESEMQRAEKKEKRKFRIALSRGRGLLEGQRRPMCSGF